ncbi:unnamed protein product [Heligmosomoides polygyrus]|uniref:BZIP domain-containing protein n=1 Tax=Heligmosomoides polygyrus TaxID=6339 RepID=A0A183GRQ1_HELPZ|nr:unnamed protein product [Heligmosomoides polygyrus]
MSDGIPTSCTERKDVFTEQSANVTSRASCPGRGTGKRFARRAKRWAELQQRRYNQRLVAVRTGFLEAHEESPCMYDSFGVPCTTTHFVSGHEALDAAPNVKNVCDTISRWMSQPRYSKQCSLTSLETSLFMTSASFEYATHTRYSIRQIASESSSTRTTNQERSKSRDLSSNSAELSDLLSSIKTDLSVTCGRTRRRSSSSTSSSTADSGSFSLHLPLSPGRAGISRFFSEFPFKTFKHSLSDNFTR